MHTQEQQRRKLSTKVAEIVGEIAVAAVFGSLFAWVVINWLMGCGESFPTADGSYIMGECLPLAPWRW